MMNELLLAVRVVQEAYGDPAGEGMRAGRAEANLEENLGRLGSEVGDLFLTVGSLKKAANDLYNGYVKDARLDRRLSSRVQELIRKGVVKMTALSDIADELGELG